MNKPFYDINKDTWFKRHEQEIEMYKPCYRRNRPVFPLFVHVTRHLYLVRSGAHGEKWNIEAIQIDCYLPACLPATASTFALTSDPLALKHDDRWQTPLAPSLNCTTQFDSSARDSWTLAPLFYPGNTIKLFDDRSKMFYKTK